MLTGSYLFSILYIHGFLYPQNTGVRLASPMVTGAHLSFIKRWCMKDGEICNISVILGGKYYSLCFLGAPDLYWRQRQKFRNLAWEADAFLVNHVPGKGLTIRQAVESISSTTALFSPNVLVVLPFSFVLILSKYPLPGLHVPVKLHTVKMRYISNAGFPEKNRFPLLCLAVVTSKAEGGCFISVVFGTPGNWQNRSGPQ